MEAISKKRLETLVKKAASAYEDIDAYTLDKLVRGIDNLDPDSAEADFIHALNYWLLEECEEAEPLLRRAVDKSPDFYDALCYLAELLFIRRQLVEAWLLFDRCKQIKSDNQLINAMMTDCESLIVEQVIDDYLAFHPA